MNLSTFQLTELAILAATSLYHAIASHQENQQPPPGTITADQAKIHCTVIQSDSNKSKDLFTVLVIG